MVYVCAEKDEQKCALCSGSVYKLYKTMFESKLSFQVVSVILTTWMTKKLDSLYYAPSTSSPSRNDPMFCGYFRPDQNQSNTNRGWYKR